MFDRRSLLAGLGLASSALPRLALAAAPTDQRLVVVILRGAMDGLSASPAFGDPDFERARNGAALAKPGEAGGALDLDGFFGLNPKLSNLHARWAKQELVVLHAISSPYRDRSHFDGQNLLENGTDKPYGLPTGWLNRSLSGLPDNLKGGRLDLGVALASAMPLMMRGPGAVTSWSPSILPSPGEDMLARLSELYQARSPKLAKALAEAVDAHSTTGDGMNGRGPDNFVVLMTAAAKFLSADNGPCVAMVESTGWDTHTGQFGGFNALDRNLMTLDQGLEALAQGLGAHWRRTAVLVMTEFGRTVARNGTNGTDHGTGGAAFLVGGAVRGGRVIADWPGLKPGDLHEGRDLKPTQDLRQVAKALLRDHLGVGEAHLERAVFPDSAGVKPMEGLMRA